MMLQCCPVRFSFPIRMPIPSISLVSYIQRLLPLPSTVRNLTAHTRNHRRTPPATTMAMTTTKIAVNMLLVQLISIGMFLLFKIALDGGKSPFVMITYRNLIAVLIVSLFYFVFERCACPPFSFLCLALFYWIDLIFVFAFKVTVGFHSTARSVGRYIYHKFCHGLHKCLIAIHSHSHIATKKLRWYNPSQRIGNMGALVAIYSCIYSLSLMLLMVIYVCVSSIVSYESIYQMDSCNRNAALNLGWRWFKLS